MMFTKLSEIANHVQDLLQKHDTTRHYICPHLCTIAVRSHGCNETASRERELEPARERNHRRIIEVIESDYDSKIHVYLNCDNFPRPLGHAVGIQFSLWPDKAGARQKIIHNPMLHFWYEKLTTKVYHLNQTNRKKETTAQACAGSNNT